MSMIRKIGPMLDYGGVNLLLFKLQDMLLKTTSSADYKYRIAKNADPSEYPRLLKDIYAANMGGVLDLSNPCTYNEKVQWLKLYDATPLKTRLADKYLVRDWVKEKIGDKYLVPQIAVYDSFDEINLVSLPDAFVLKCNHGSGWNAIVQDKERENFEEWKQKFEKWMSMNFAFLSFELQYRDIPPKIVCEELIEANIVDYRVYCFDGEPMFIKVTQHNPNSEGGYDSGLYYPDWQKCEFRMVQGYGELEMKRPDHLDELINVAKTLSEGFNFVRVDFYIVENKIYFSEMTFTPNSGFEKFEDAKTALRFGEMIRLR